MESRENLKEVPGFPGYYVDCEKMEAWSYCTRIRSKGHEKQWQRLKIYDSGMFVTRRQDGKKTSVSLAKSIYAIKNNLQYDDPILKTVTFKIQDGKLLVRGFCEAMHETMRKRRTYEDIHRVQITQHRIDVLQMVLQAYKGEPSRLFVYVAKHKERYLNAIKAKYRYISEHRVGMSYDLTFQKMVDVIHNKGSVSADFDGWFVKTARGFIAKELKFTPYIE